ncbi:MAG: pentapeptide repeat-containing protein [Streptosporangiaceae bacterium]
MTRKPARRSWKQWLYDPDPPYLWKIGYALATCFLVAVAGLAALWGAALWLLHARVPAAGVLSVHDTVGVAQLVFASVAGTGALVALVVAYRRQRVAETASSNDRFRVFNERFTTIAAQLGDSQAAVRLAGVHAMAGLADDWAENRQTCVDVLCAYLRLPYQADPGDDAPADKQLEFQAEQQVRHTIIRLISAHLRERAASSWQGLNASPWWNLNFDFTGARFDGCSFDRPVFAGRVSFDRAVFSGGDVSFAHAEFSGNWVSFDQAVFSGGLTSFNGAVFSGNWVSFDRAVFSGGLTSFNGAVFSGLWFSFVRAMFSGGAVSFANAEFSGMRVSFQGAEFAGSQIDLREPADWSHPPVFDFSGIPPAGLLLPEGWTP